MKLQIVPARRGIQWVKSGIRTFFKQPLALAGLFFMFLALMSVLSLVPVVGTALALALLPAVTVGLMAATREAADGKFPMPMMLLAAFRSGRQSSREMLTLGALYAVGFMLVLGLSALIDGGRFAQTYLSGMALTAELISDSDFRLAMLTTSLVGIPMSLMFWHAPALVLWHGVSPVKSLFFSLVACMRNFWAFTLYGVAWMGVFLAAFTIGFVLAAVLENPNVLMVMLYPVAAAFFTSIYFTFIDSFAFDSGENT
jgi:hypothetical protein